MHRPEFGQISNTIFDEKAKKVGLGANNKAAGLSNGKGVGRVLIIGSQHFKRKLTVLGPKMTQPGEIQAVSTPRLTDFG